MGKKMPPLNLRQAMTSPTTKNTTMAVTMAQQRTAKRRKRKRTKKQRKRKRPKRKRRKKARKRKRTKRRKRRRKKPPNCSVSTDSKVDAYSTRRIPNSKHNELLFSPFVIKQCVKFNSTSQ